MFFQFQINNTFQKKKLNFQKDNKNKRIFTKEIKIGDATSDLFFTNPSECKLFSPHPNTLKKKEKKLVSSH